MTTPQPSSTTIKQSKSAIRSNSLGKVRLKLCFFPQLIIEPFTGGWDIKSEIPESLEEQIANSFANIESALKSAGVEGGFSKVFSIRSYHVAMDDNTTVYMVNAMKEKFTGHKPIWTAIGVEKLAIPAMKVEIEAVAVLE